MSQIVTVDHREQRSKVFDFLKNQDIEVEVVNNQKSDYIVNGCCAIERKTIVDFIASIKDKRIFNQTKQLKLNFIKRLIILEGGGLYMQQNRLSSNALRGVQIWISIFEGVPIIRTYNEEDTAQFIKLLARKLEMNRIDKINNTTKSVKTIYQQQTAMLSSIRGIGPLLSRSLMDRFKNLHTIISASELEISQISGIGLKKAKMIKAIMFDNLK